MAFPRAHSEGSFRRHVLPDCVDKPGRQPFGAGNALRRSSLEWAVTTTEEILSDLPTFFAADSWLRKPAARTVREFLSGEAVDVIPQSHESFVSGFALYASRPDNGYSLTDCISMQAMRREGLTDILTNDRHFEREGFHALFRDS
jgi:predicted nucleic acid-binding protein